MWRAHRRPTQQKNTSNAFCGFLYFICELEAQQETNTTTQINSTYFRELENPKKTIQQQSTHIIFVISKIPKQYNTNQLTVFS